MALANVAWLLAETYQKKVLVVDWDLEAPGLHRFFELKDKEIEFGLLDLLYDYKELLREEKISLPKKLVDVKKYIALIEDFGDDKGSISILAAGSQDRRYASRVNEFSWEKFYEKWYGFAFIESLKAQLKEVAEIILVDSRTGVTDIGGICTLQLPDVVVILFSLNEQNISGTEYLVESILKKSTEVSRKKSPPALILKPSRVEIAGGQDMKIRWEEIAADRLGKYLPDTVEPLRYIKKKNIPYIGDYSYGETPLAVQKDPLGQLSESFENLASSILQASGLLEKETVTLRKPHSVKNWSKYFVQAIRKYSKQHPYQILTSGFLLILLLIGYMFSSALISDLREQALREREQALREREMSLQSMRYAEELNIENKMLEVKIDSLNKVIQFLKKNKK